LDSVIHGLENFFSTNFKTDSLVKNLGEQQKKLEEVRKLAEASMFGWIDACKNLAKYLKNFFDSITSKIGNVVTQMLKAIGFSDSAMDRIQQRKEWGNPDNEVSGKTNVKRSDMSNVTSIPRALGIDP